MIGNEDGLEKVLQIYGAGRQACLGSAKRSPPMHGSAAAPVLARDPASFATHEGLALFAVAAVNHDPRARSRER